jgi:putative ABC transport system permease protein
MADFRYALRALLKRPAFSALIIATLAIAIGANSAIFSVVNGVLLRPLPFANPDRLVMAWTVLPAFGREVSSLPDFRDWREQAKSFSSMSALASSSFGLSGDGDLEPERVPAARVTANFFRTLGVSPVVGRGFADEEEIGDVRRVVISHELWQRRFGGRADILDQPLRVSGEPWEIIGVLPAGFRAVFEPRDVYAPLDVSADGFTRRADFLAVFGRLAPGVTIEAADAELKAIMRQLDELYPQTNDEVTAEVVSLREEVVGTVRPALLVFMGAVGLVLLIACANVANLLLARGAGRDREMAVRAALGAGRGRLVRQTLVESVVLSVVGAAVGLLLAGWTIPLLQRADLDMLPRLDEVSIDARVVLFTIGLSLVVGVLFGMAPALRLSGTALAGSLRDGQRAITGGSGLRDPRRLLVMAEVSLAMLLLVGAGLLIRSFERLQRVDVGVRTENVLTAFLALPNSRYPEMAQAQAFQERLDGELRRIPGVSSVAYTNQIPASGGSNYLAFGIDGRDAPPAGTPQDAQRYVVTPEYFRLYEIALRQGRTFTEQDREGAQDVALINETMARRHWPDADPIGQRITFDGTRYFSIVGIVADTRQEGVDEAPYPQAYVSRAQLPTRAMSIALRTTGDPLEVVPALRRTVRSLDGDIALSQVQSMREVVGSTIAQPRINTIVLSVFAGIALLLAAIGIYGVTSYAVAQRTREIGVRMALGARRGTVLGLVVRQGMLPVAAGLAVGLLAAFAATRVMQSLLFEVNTTDPLTFASITALLAAIALVASVVPALRASRVDPVVALRSEG